MVLSLIYCAVLKSLIYCAVLRSLIYCAVLMTMILPFHASCIYHAIQT